MGVDCPILAMFNGNRSDDMYIEIKSMSFLMGSQCQCGAKISSEKEIVPMCDTRDALCNHVIYPTFSLLKFNKDSSYRNDDEREKNNCLEHTALLVDLCKIPMHEQRAVGAMGFTNANEKTIVDLRRLYSGENNQFPWSNLKVGHTLAVLYPKRDEKSGLVFNFFEI